MTDKEKTIQLFTEFGIEFETKENQQLHNCPEYADCYDTITISEGIGFLDFYTEFFFDKDGKFVVHGVWE